MRLRGRGAEEGGEGGAAEPSCFPNLAGEAGSSGAREVLELLGGLDEEAAGRHLDAHLRAVLEPHEQARVPGGGEKG